MNQSHFCQSCSMPIETIELHGTESDGSKSKLYCCYCYQNGAFIEPNISFEEMMTNVKGKIDNLKIPGNLRWEMIVLSEKLLPSLERWKKVLTEL